MYQKEFRISDIFSLENYKLGRIYSFSMPAILTCPGMSRECGDRCYAMRSRFAWDPVQAKYFRNYEISLREDFPSIVTDLLSRMRRDRPDVRLHVSGDIYDRAYGGKWLEVVKQSQHVRFLAYTRSWRVPEIVPVLEELAACRNFRMFYSADRETGLPRRKPAAVRIAWMQIDEAEAHKGVDLYFRDHSLRKTPRKHVGGTMVCPPENGTTHTTCDRCQICFSDPREEPAKRTKGRLALQLV